MESSKSPGHVISVSGESLDPAAAEKVRDILHHLANTVSAMKIFPSEHATIMNFVGLFVEKIKSYLELYGKLEIAVGEYSFGSGGRTVYTDEMTIKSLPFFFFKDGMQMLYFYQGLDREEIVDFLELIKKESQKPAEESDIVTAIWERDFVNIQYFAPDEYLESRILEERSETEDGRGSSVLPSEFARDIIEVKVDTSRFSTWKVTLTEEDRAAIEKGPAVGETADEPKPAVEEDTSGGEEDVKSRRSLAATMDPTLTDAEIQNLEGLIRTNRTISPEEEFLDLMVEIVFLEKDLPQLSSNLDVLLEYHVDELQRGNFTVSILLVHKFRDLEVHLAGIDPDKAALIGTFLKKIISEKTLDAVRDLINKKQAVAWDALIDFFTVLGPPALSLAAGIYDSMPDPDAQAKILEYVRGAAKKDPAVMAGLAGDERPGFSKAIMGLLAAVPGHKGLAHFSAFLGYQRKDIKLEAVNILSRIQDEMANRILLGFLNDKDEDIRVQAALVLNPTGEYSRIKQVIQDASSRAFRVRSLKEKKAILAFLGRTKTEEAFAFLRKTLTRRGLWPTPGTADMMVAAVEGLESMGTPEAIKALEKGARSRRKAVQEACARALARLASLQVKDAAGR